jgi:hypothetical protein
LRIAKYVLRVACCVLLLAGIAHSQRNKGQVSIRLRPDSTTVQVGGSAQFRAEVRGTPNQAVEWSVVGNGKDEGSISPQGLYTTPETIITPAVVTVRAVSEAEASAEATATVNVPEVGVSVSPTQTQVQAGGTVQLKAKVTNAIHNAVQWFVDGGSGNGMVSRSGLFTLPQTVVTPTTLTVRAISVADPSKMAVAKIAVLPISLSVEPSRADVEVGGSKQFRASIKGTSISDVIWEVVGGKEHGAISDSGLYTAPQSAVTPATVLIKATSAVDPTKFAFAQITLPAVGIIAAPNLPRESKVRGIPVRAMSVIKMTIPFDPIDSLIVGPLFRGKSGKLYIPAGGSYQFYASVNGTKHTDVKWSLEGTQPLGSISESGLFVAPSVVNTPKTIVVKATSVADPTKTSLTHLNIPPVVIKAEPQQAEVCCGAVLQFKSTVDNTENDAVRWTVIGGEENGSISETGLYTPPHETMTPKTVTLKATSVADPSKEALVTVRIPEVSIDIRPNRIEVPAGGTHLFSAKLNGTKHNALKWSVEDGSGNVTPAGLFTAPARVTQPTLVKVKVASASDPSKFAVAMVKVKPRK